MASSRLMVPSRIPLMHWQPAMTRRSQRTRPSRVAASARVVVAGQPQVVAGLPRLAGDDRAGRAEVLPGRGRGGQDGRRIPLAVEEELDDVLPRPPGVVEVGGRLVPLGELAVDPGDGQQGLPAHVLAHGHVDMGVGVDLDDPGRALGPLQVAPGPVDGLGHACQQHGALLRVSVRIVSTRGSVGGRSASDGRSAAHGSAGSTSAPSARAAVVTVGPARRVSTTQVSLLPPPCDELTTREPARRATRVRPPRVT